MLVESESTHFYWLFQVTVDPRRRHELITHWMRMSSWSKKLTWRSQEVLRRRREPKRRTSLQKLSPDMLNLFCTFWRPRLSDRLLWPCVGKLFQRATTFMLTSRANSRRNFREKPMQRPPHGLLRPPPGAVFMLRPPQLCGARRSCRQRGCALFWLLKNPRSICLFWGRLWCFKRPSFMLFWLLLFYSYVLSDN